MTSIPWPLDLSVSSDRFVTYYVTKETPEWY
jgi:hypothetical protein